ncbi:MAG: hypothetical protein WBA10_18740 [Elainellaceae cyanobacterium]
MDQMEQSNRLSVTELTQRILQMSEAGVYRGSIFDVFRSFAIQKDIRRAIAYAKTFGLYSVPSLRDSALGTYYQLDPQAYEQRKHQIKDIAAWETKWAQQDAAEPNLTASGDTIIAMLAMVKSLMVLLLILSASCWLSGQGYIAGVSLVAAIGTALTWQLQCRLVKRHQILKADPARSIKGQTRSSRR